jgi:glyoxylase-like metal-dependent hydrolase (beta-lactamase superfamily II)
MSHSADNRKGGLVPPTSMSRRALLRSGALLAGTGVAAGALGTRQAVAATITTAPVPPGAMGPPIPAEGYLLDEIGDDLFWLTDGLYQMMFLRTDHGVVVVDAPPTIGNNITRAIARVTSNPVTDLVYSHHHADHIGAAAIFEGKRIRRYAHVDTADLLAEVSDPNRPAPNRTFERSRRIQRGRHTLQLDYRGPNHSYGNLFVYAPQQKVLMLVDVIFPGWVPFAYLAISTNVPGWVTAHDKALAYPFETLIGGHLTRLGTRADVAVQQEYITDLRREVTAALSHPSVLGAAFDPTSVDQTNPWAVFEAYLDAAATRASDMVVPSWVTRLGGADVFTDENAFAMAEAVRVDYGDLGPFGVRP